MSVEVARAYDEVQYLGASHALSHPDRLAAIARLHGVAAPSADGARVLEIGCACAENIGPMGLSLPSASLLGVDVSPKQIETGTAALAAAGVRNVRLRVLDVATAGDLGAFDFIVAHGVYSWVEPPVADAILAFIGRSLAPHGVAYLSYNAYPGWYERRVLRDLLLFHLRGVEGARARVEKARAVLLWLAETLGKSPRADHARALAREDEWYIAHDHLSADNHPVHFHELVLRAEAHGLAYLDDAQPNVTAEHGTTAHAAKAREVGGADPIAAEQYMDWLYDRSFRQTLLCRASAAPARSTPPEAIEELRVSSRARPQGALDVRRRGATTFSYEGDAVTTDHPLTKAALAHLTAVAPRRVPFPELLEKARALSGGGSDRDASLARRFFVRAFFTTTMFDLSTYDAPFVGAPGERPTASAWARVQARRGIEVTSVRHETVRLDEDGRRFLLLLDGTRDRAALARDGKLPAGYVDGVLSLFASSALLVA